MELTNTLQKFLNEMTGFYKSEINMIDIFKILSFFTDNGEKYLTNEGRKIIGILSNYAEIFKNKQDDKNTGVDFESIITEAANIASNVLSPRIDLNHFILSVVNTGVKKDSLPQEMLMKISNTLSSRKSIQQKFIPEKDMGKVNVQKGNPVKHINPFTFEAELLEKVYLNREIAKEISNFLLLKNFSLDLKPYLSHGIFLFIGNKCSGKSEMAYSIAEAFYSSRENVAEIDLAMFTDSATPLFDSIQNEENKHLDIQTNLFIEISKDDRKCVYLMKHFEFVNKVFFQILMQIFTNGYIFYQGKKMSFSDSIFIITIDKNIVTSLTKKIGFQNFDEDKDNLEIKSLIKKEYGEDFVSLFDGIYIFNSITVDDYKQIFSTKLKLVVEQLKKKGYEFNISRKIIEHLADSYYNETKTMPNQISSFIERILMIPLLQKIMENPDKRVFKAKLVNENIVIN